MSSVHSLKSIQHLPTSLEKAWNFFSDPNNLLTITPPFLNLRLTGSVFGTEVYSGQVMTYTVKPLMGIPLSWMTEIKHVDKGKLFVDEQRKGPYRLWHHQHHFREIDGGVEMTDLVHYRLPLGWLGQAAHGLFVKNKLREIFQYRDQRINEQFGAWPGGRMQLEID